ncbi:hypothetical protein [Cupriavidus oxalaticus]|jgi:hypothetical protein|uniref:Uncharacterized protein n=1 Tax=Cupriavidus oxalaticus TaxID=96344 RepID=A0A976BFM5_9BURK|nr:hypothetical protein [Cupriavidus oxalaticus]WQD84101.1 hypothetical protein U0036_06200 [Cupriavidus oxalaticus]SPC17421.1 exported hypothetical protein [Cupriavidus oxalaticus]
MARTLPTAILVLSCLIVSPVSHAGGEYKEKFRSGPCKIEREVKRDGEYKEVRKCKDGPRGYERKEKYRDGPCLIERKWDDDGEYEEKVECKRS